jgi:RHS repeat-associated protein
VNREAMVLFDGTTTKTYITSYTHNLAGQLTSMTYPNGKVVNYTRDSQGRETKAWSTYNGQAFDYIYGASYGGQQGALTRITYPIYNGSARMTVEYSYDPKNLFLSDMQIADETLSYKYVTPSNSRSALIYDVVNINDSYKSEHYAYDKMDRLTSYWVSRTRSGTASRKLELGYDRYGNISSVAETISGVTQTYSFSVNAATNRLQSRTISGGTYSFSYDAAGNMTSKGVFDAENRLTSSNGTTYLYGGTGQRIRRQGGSTVNYVYSYAGQLLVEDNVTASTTDNHIYFAGQALAIQGQQDGTFKLLFKDRQGSTRRSYTVTVPSYSKVLNEKYEYDPWGQIISSYQPTPPFTNYRYQGKERGNNLDNFGARNYDALGIGAGSSMRWISADPVTSNIYDPQSLNKYTYVRNDPVNMIDPDGRAVIFSPNPFLFYQSQFITGNEFNAWFNQAMGNNTMADYNAMLFSYGFATIPGYAGPDQTIVLYFSGVAQGQANLAAAEAASGNGQANGEIVGARIVGQPGTEVEENRPYNIPTPLGCVLAACAIDIGFPDPTDIAIPKWAGWGLGITGAAIVTAVAPDILRPIYERRGKGERRRAAKPDGTPNQWKHTRPHPTDPDKIIYRDPHTGKDVVKPRPRDYGR